MPAFVTPSATTRPFRRLREFNDCNLPKGESDGGRFGANDDPRCAGGAGDADRWGALRDTVRIPRIGSEDTRTSATKGGATIEPGFDNVQVEFGDEYNARVPDFVLGGRTPDDVADAMLKYVAEEFVVEVHTSGQTIDGEELFNPVEARAAWEQEQRRIRPEEIKRRKDLTSYLQSQWMTTFAMSMSPGGGMILALRDLSKQLQPADPARATGVTAAQAMRTSIEATAAWNRASYGGDPAQIQAAGQQWLAAMQTIKDAGFTINDLHTAFGTDSKVWEEVALAEFAQASGDQTVLQPIEDYVAARARTYEQYVQDVWGDEANAEVGEGAVQFSMEGSDGTEITRTFKRNAYHDLYVKHDLFETPTGGGMAKDLLRGSFELYEQMGVKAIKTTANISTGSYSWARFGFLPENAAEAMNLGGVIEQARYDDVIAKIKDALGDYWHEDLAKQIKAPITRLKAGDRAALWDLADLRLKGTPEQMQQVGRLFDSSTQMTADFYLKHSDTQRWDSTISRDALQHGMFNVGRVLLTGLGYNARFDMKQRPVSEYAPATIAAQHAADAKLLARQRQRLVEYIGDWTKPR